MTARLIICIFLFNCLAGCKKEAPVDLPVNDYSAKLEVKVSQCLNNICDSIAAAAGARVFLYENEQYRQEGSPIAAAGTTSATGQCSFISLDSSKYWLLIRLPEPDGRVMKAYAGTPPRTTTFVEVLFK